MTWWTPDTMRAACGGSWVVRPPQIELPPDRPADLPLPALHAPILGVSTDTRTLKPGQAFVALRGESFDGHRFVAQAAAGGAPIIIVDDPTCVPTGGFVPAVGVMKVADTGAALLKLAGAYRKSLARTKVVAVCGSNGKTTTTRLIHHVLGQHYRGTASIKSFNNAVGVPLTILSAKENDQFLVCEVGTNAPGEIAQLGAVVQPDIAVIVSIGREHLELLSNLDGVAKEEASILKFVRAKGCVVATGDAPELAEYLSKSATHGQVVVTFGRDKNASLRLTQAAHEVKSDGTIGLKFTMNARQEVRIGLVGEHNALNAMAALAVARRMGLDDAKAIATIETAAGAEMRLSLQTIGDVRVINDAYNANPDSMLAAIDTAAKLRGGVLSDSARLVLVLGQMLELGAASDESHRLVARGIAALGPGAVQQVVLVGPAMRTCAEELCGSGFAKEQVLWLGEMDDAGQQAMASRLRAGDLVLLKGSRGVKLERALGAIERLTSASRQTQAAEGGSPATRDGSSTFPFAQAGEMKPSGALGAPLVTHVNPVSAAS